MPAMMRLLVPGLVLALATGCQDTAPVASAARASAPASDLDSLRLTAEPVVDEIVLDGYLEALQRVTIASEVSARVEQLPFDVGDLVTDDAVVVRFRDAAQQARAQAARAGLEEARARLAEMTETHRRALALHERELIANARMEAAQAAFDAATARVASATAELRGASEALEHTVVRAPYEAVVLERHIDAGETATMGQPLLTVLSLAHMRAVVDVPQSVMAALPDDVSARIILADGRSIRTTALRLPPSADPGSHAFRVLAQLPEGHHGARPGILVKVAFAGDRSEAVHVPATAVVQRGELVAVYVIDNDGALTLRQIRLGDAPGDARRRVLSGLEAGERIAVDAVAAGIVRSRRARVDE